MDATEDEKAKALMDFLALLARVSPEETRTEYLREFFNKLELPEEKWPDMVWLLHEVEREKAKTS